MQLGIFGGTFDPPHSGHKQLASYLLKEKDLDKLFLIPANITPYPDKTSNVSFEHRYRMTELLVENNPGLEVSDVEGKRRGNSYTIDTIRSFKKKYNLNSSELILVIGSDSLARFDEWKLPDAILNECKICVLKRKNISVDDIQNRFIKSVELLNNKLIEISSTDLRGKIINGEDVSDHLDESIIDYIRKNGLYRQ